MIKYLATLIICVFTTGTPAKAENLLNWGETGGWAILVDPTVGSGCLMEKHIENDTLVRIGTDPGRDGGFFAAYNPEWTDIKDGATGTVQFEFPEIRFVGEIVGVAKNGLFGGYAFFDNPNVLKEFTARNNMSIIGEFGRSIDLALAGSMKAIAAVKACQAEQPK